TISGGTVVGATLTGTTGTWTGTAPINYALQWGRCDSAGNSCANISGATSTTYVTTTSDVTHTIRLNVTASNTAGSATATSAAAGPITSSSSSNPCGSTASPPTHYQHVVIFSFENRTW